MKLSRTAIKELTAKYRAVLLKCAMLNMAAAVLLATATPAKADLTISNGTVDWQDFYYLNHNNLNITGGIVSNSGIVGFDQVNTANTYHPVMTNNYFETKTDLSRINFAGGTFADTIARAHGTGSDLTVSGGTFAGRLLLSAVDTLTITDGTYGTAETPLTALELRAHAITTPRSVLAMGASNYAIAAATGTLTLTFGEDNPWAISKTVLSAPDITTGTLTASGNTHIGFTPVIEKYTYTPEAAEPVSVFSFKNAKPLTDVTVENSAITLKDSSKIGVGFIGTEIPVDVNIVETGTDAAFIGGAQIAAAETDRDNLVQTIKDAIDAVVEMIDPNSELPLAPEARYVHLPAVVRDVLDIEYERNFIDTTEDDVADTWTSTSLTDQIRDLLATGDADDITAAKGLVEEKIAAAYNNYVHNGADGINAVLTTMNSAPGVGGAYRYGLLPDDVKDVLANTTYVTEHSNTLAEFVDWAYANVGDADERLATITGAVTAALNDVNLTIKNTTVNMEDTSSIVNASSKVNPINGNVIFTTAAGTTAVNVTGGTGEEKYNTIAAHNNIIFNAGSTLTVGSAEEEAAGSKLNMTATNGNIEFDEAGIVTVNAGSTVNMQANQGVIYSESGALKIGSAAANAAMATVKVRTTNTLALTNDPAADGFGLDLDYTEFWNLHSDEIDTEGKPGYINAALREGNSNYHPAYTVLGMTPDAPAIAKNTLTIADSTLTANNAVIDGNLFFHNTKTVTQTLANSTVKGNVSIANEAPAQIAETNTAFTLNATTATIEGNVKAYTGNYTAAINVDSDADTLERSGSVTTLNLKTVGGTVTTAGTAESRTNVYVKTQTGSPASVEPPVDAVDGSITMTGGTLSLTVGEDAADAEEATVYGNIAMTGGVANLTISEVATVTGNVIVSDATPATLALNGTIGGNATFTGDVLMSDAKASKGTVTGGLLLSDGKEFNMQNGAAAYVGKYDNLTVNKITAGTAGEFTRTVLSLDVDTGSVSHTKNIDKFTLTGSGSSGELYISSIRNEKYNGDDYYTFEELWSLSPFSQEIVSLDGEGASSAGLAVTLNADLTTVLDIATADASWNRVITEVTAHSTDYATDTTWGGVVEGDQDFHIGDKVTTRTTNLSLSAGCASGEAGACILTYTKATVEEQNNVTPIGNKMVALNQLVQATTQSRSMTDVNAEGTRFRVTEHLNDTGAGTFTINGYVGDNPAAAPVSVIDMNSMNGFTVGEKATLNLNHVSFDNVQRAESGIAGTKGKVLNITAGGKVNLDSVVLAGDNNFPVERYSEITNAGMLTATGYSDIELENAAGATATISGHTILRAITTNAAAAQLTFYGAYVTADAIENNGLMILAEDVTDLENIVGAELTTDLTGTGNVTVQEHSILTLAETDADKNNTNVISGAGMTIVDNDALTTLAAITSNISVNNGKKLTGAADLIGEAGKTVTNNGTLALTGTDGDADPLVTAANIVNNTDTATSFTITGNVRINGTLTGAVAGANPGDPTTPAVATLAPAAKLTLGGTENTNTINGGDGAAIIVKNLGATEGHGNERLRTTGVLNVATTIEAGAKLVASADMIGADVTNAGTLALSAGATAANINNASLVTTTGNVTLSGNLTNAAGTVTNTGVLTLAGETNANAIGGTGSIVIDSDNLTTTGALNQAVRVNAAKQLTAIADLIGADVTNNGTVVLKEGTLRHNITFGENADLSIVDGDANAETGVRSNVNLAKATIQDNALLIINADKVRGAFVNNLGGTVNLTGGTLTKALGGKVTLSGATTFGTGADFTGATIKMTGAGSLNIGTNKVTANSVDGGTIFMTLTENAVEDTLVNIAEVVNRDVSLTVDNSNVSRFDVQHYYLTATDTGYNLTLTGAGRYAISTQEFGMEDVLTMADFDPATWQGGDLYMLKLATVAEVAAEKQVEKGIGVSINERGAVQTMADEVRANLGEGQKAKFDQINNMLANAVDEENNGQIRQILKEVGAEKAPAVAQTEVANVGAVMSVIGNRLGGAAPAPAAGVERGHSGGSEFRIGKVAAWGQMMFNKAKLDKTDGFDSDSNGFALGFETEINGDYKAGIGYAHASSDIKTDRSKTDVNTNTFFAYGEYKPNNFYVNGVLSFGNSSYDEKNKADRYHGRLRCNNTRIAGNGRIHLRKVDSGSRIALYQRQSGCLYKQSGRSCREKDKRNFDRGRRC